MAVESPDIDAFVYDLSQINTTVARLFRTAMQKTVDIAESAVVGHTPVNTDALRGSVAHDITGTVLNLTGEVFTPLVYGLSVERGRRPGKPPPTEAIKLWVIRKMDLTGKEADSAAYLIARAIGKRGTSGAAMFYEGFEQTKPIAYRIWDEVGADIIRELAT